MPFTGCPCGCMTKRPWLIDPDCVRERWPLPPPDPAILRDILARLFPQPAKNPGDSDE